MPIGTIMGLRRYRDEESCPNGSYRVQSDSAKSVELQQEVGQGAVAPRIVGTRVSNLRFRRRSACLVVVCWSPIVKSGAAAGHGS